jgi:RNA polymerase sigma-70 factor, ECF subfamily
MQSNNRERTASGRALVGSAAALDEDELVRRAQASDQAAFREIVERYQDKVFSLVGRLLRNREEAEDIAQEVFTSAFFAIRRYECRGSLLSWIYRITVNECYAYLRKKRARPLVYESEMSGDGHHAAEVRSRVCPFDKTIADRDFVLKLLARVSEQERCLLLMRDVEGYSIQELSAILGINENSIKVKLFRTRQKLLIAAGRRRAPAPV